MSRDELPSVEFSLSRIAIELERVADALETRKPGGVVLQVCALRGCRTIQTTESAVAGGTPVCANHARMVKP